MPDKYIIISASRMTDLPAFYPEALIYEINQRLQKGLKIHSLVLWTKHIGSLFQEPLYSCLSHLKSNGIQLFVHLTITGMAQVTIGYDKNGKPVIPEPNVPLVQDTVDRLPELIKFTGKADRIRLRIDPLVRILDYKKSEYSNYHCMEEIINSVAPMGIKNFIFSFLENNMHQKVNKRFSDRGLTILSPDSNDRKKFFVHIKNLEEQYNITMSSCCVPGLTTSRCIDGYNLEKLHDMQIPVSKKEPHNRLLCGCTESVDIGGWPPKICKSGCLYCYSRPLLFL